MDVSNELRCFPGYRSRISINVNILTDRGVCFIESITKSILQHSSLSKRLPKCTNSPQNLIFNIMTLSISGMYA